MAHAGQEQRSSHPDAGNRPRRGATILVAFAVSASAGVLFLARLAPTAARDGDSVDAGSELVIFCSDEGATVEPEVVAVQADGLHVSVTNRTGARLLYMRDPERIARSTAFELQPHTLTKHVIPSIKAGTWIAGCVAASGSFSTYGTPLSEYSAPFDVANP